MFSYSLHFVERPIVDYGSGLAVSTLRVREDSYLMHNGEMVLKTVGNPQYSDYLKTAVISLFDIYGPGAFDLHVTCNAILMGNHNKRYSLWYGQTFSRKEYYMGHPEVLENPGDYANIQTDFTVDDFSDVFFRNHENSDVSILSLTHLVFIFTRYLDNFERDRTCGTTLTTIF
jgi:hypothetical protein